MPEQFSFQTEKALISATQGRGLWRAQVLSFHRLSYYVFGKTGGIEKKILEDSGKHMLLRKIISEKKQQLLYFKSGQEKRGFVDALASSITEFYQYGIEPEELLAKAEASEAANLQLKLQDLHLIYSEYKNYIEQEYISSDEILDILAEKILQADFLHGAEIWLDGFKSFTPQEKKVLSTLITIAKSVKFTLCLNPRNEDNSDKFDAFFEARDTMRQIEEMADGLGIDVEEPEILDKPMRYDKADDIAFLCENFLGFSSKTYTRHPKNIRIFSADNIYSEIAIAAKTVTMLVRDRGFRYREIGVISANLAQYEKYVAAIFSQYDIPVFVDARREILGHPLIELIFAALEVMAANWQYEAVFRLLRCALSPIPRDEIDMLENYVLAYNARGKAWVEGFVLGNDDEKDIANAIRAKVVAFAEPLLVISNVKKTYKVIDVATAIYSFLEENEINQTLGNLMSNAHDSGDNEALRQHEQVWGKIIDTLDKLVEILGESNQSVADFAKIFEEGMTDLGLSPPSLDQLVVGDLRRSRFGELRALVVLGANEGMMPSRPEVSGLLDDSDRSTLASDGMNLAKDFVAKIYEEEFLIYSNFAKPKEYLAISFYNGDLEGGASAKSRIIERLTEIFPKIAITKIEDIPKNSVAHISSQRATFSDMVVNMRDGMQDILPIYADAHDFFCNQPDFAEKLKDIGLAAEFSAQNDMLSKKTIRNLYGRRMRTSVSKLERYISCPFSYFVEYNLEAKPRKLYEATAVDMGNIYHDILSQFGEMIQQVSEVNSLGETKVSEMVETALNCTLENPKNQILDSSGKYKHYTQRLRDISRLSAEVLTKHLKSGDFALAFNEVAFSDFTKNNNSLTLGAIEIPLDESSMLLDGRIDRVDIGEINGEEYVKIIDYKSGQHRFSLSEVFHGLDMQLLIYLYAFIQKLSEARGEGFTNKILPAAALYFNLLNPIVTYGEKFRDNPDAIKDEIMRNFKMSGIVLEESHVIYAMDKDLVSESHILPVSLKKGSTPQGLSVKKESTTIDMDGFYALMSHVVSIAQDAGRGILDGNIAVVPAKHKDKHPCKYCGYRSICKFDATLAGSGGKAAYRHLQYLKNDEVIAKILASNDDKKIRQND